MRGSFILLYKYETHSHTSQTSRCSKISGAELARFYKALGYTGLIVTDHFFNGNTTVGRDIAWKERVELFERGYLDAKAEGEKIGLDVFFAWEYTWSGGNDFLIYGLDREWLLANPDQLEWRPKDYMRRVRAGGGLVIHAHPFRESDYIECMRLVPREVDGVEVMNSSRPDLENSAAVWYANNYGLLKLAGSDNHVGRRERLAGVYLPERISDMRSFVHIIKEGKHELFLDRYDEEGRRL